MVSIHDHTWSYIIILKPIFPFLGAVYDVDFLYEDKSETHLRTSIEHEVVIALKDVQKFSFIL